MLAALLAACTGIPDRNGEAAVPSGAGAADGLAATLNVGVHGDTARLELHVTNETAAAVTLEFPTAQRYDFEIRTGSGELSWRWSDDMMFGQVLGREVLAAGQTLRYEAAWVATGAGDYVATGRVVSTNLPVELRTPFRMPGS